MSKLILFRHPMNSGVFEAMVNDRAKMSHMVIQTDHLRVRMIERGISLRQVLNVLRKGTLADGPHWNAAHASYEGTMKYHGTGREITVLCGIRESNLLVFAVTTY